MPNNKTGSFGAFFEGQMAGALTGRKARTTPYATRQRVSFVAMGMLLPNPDTIMRQLNLVNINYVYRQIRTDPHVRGTIKSRKAGVLRLKWDIERGEATQRVTSEIKAMLNDLQSSSFDKQVEDDTNDGGQQINNIMSNMLEACQFGFKPQEVMWAAPNGGKYWVPKSIVGKSPAWFGFGMDDNRPKLKTLKNPTGEEIPPYKFLFPTQEWSYDEPYGVADLSSCFWPVTFKKSTIGFWMSFAEKYGQVFAIINSPRANDDTEKQKLLDAAAQMIQDAVFVGPEDSAVKLLESSGKTATSGLFKDLRAECIDEINVVQLGHSASAKATAGKLGGQDDAMKVREDIMDSDKRIPENSMNKLIAWICKFNFPASGLPRFTLFEEKQGTKELADRDGILTKDVGVRFKKKYISGAYNLNEEDFEMVEVGKETGENPENPAAEYSEGNSAPASSPLPAVDALTDRLAAEATPVMDKLWEPIEKLLTDAKSLEEVRDKITSLYPNLDIGPLTALINKAQAAAAASGAQESKGTARRTPTSSTP